ncbi:hypothetical protein ACFC01_47440 [Streptomyces mirabilis]
MQSYLPLKKSGAACGLFSGESRTRLRRLAGAQTWAGLGIFAYNSSG